MAAALALIAAAIFALGTVLQQRAAMTEPDDQAASNTILLRLATHPVWLAGIAAYGIAYGVQAAALGSGQIVVVQPVLATTIVFALPLGVWLSHQRISRRDVLAAAAVTVGLGAFLVFADPGGALQRPHRGVADRRRCGARRGRGPGDRGGASARARSRPRCSAPRPG